MADNRISKVTVRQGNFADLPMLDSGEFGYALDDHRLFIGNQTVEIGTGNGTTDAFPIPAELSATTNITAVYVGGTQVNEADYSLNNNVLSLATPPALNEAVTARYNAEVKIERYSNTDHVQVVDLAANGNLAETGVIVDTSLYNVVVMDYSISSANGLRIGQLRFGTDGTTTTIDDNYTETGTIDIVFSLDAGTANQLKLIYTDNDNLLAKFKYKYNHWNSN